MIKKQFNTRVDFIHLNHARLSPWPQCTREAVIQFSQSMQYATAQQSKEWYETEQQLRTTLARLLHASSAENIALLKNTSEALSIIATGLEWQMGDNIVLAQQEFPSNRIVWQALEKQGVRCVLVDLNQQDDPEQVLMDACDSKTRLLTVSAVQYSDGLRLDVARLGRFCQQQNAVRQTQDTINGLSISSPLLFCVDAAQQLGAYPFDVQAMQIDFLVSCGHKWLCGPEGMGILYVGEPWLTQMKLQHYGWHMLENIDFEQQTWKAATTAQRFECGSLNTLNNHILQHSLHFFETIGFKKITEALTEHIDYLYAELQAAGFDIATPRSSQQRAGIISFRIPEKDSMTLSQYFNQHGLICSQRGANIRFSPHFYLSEIQLKSIIPRIKQILLS